MLYCTSGLACYQQFKMVEETSHSLCWSQQAGTIGVGVVISLIKSQIVVTVRISKFGCYQQLIQDSFQCHNRESRRLFHSYILSQERDAG